MAHYTITYTCGHTDRVNLIGPHRSRERRIATLESGLCFDCYKTASHAAAREQAAELELPPLVGSEKQIPWAETLRVKQLTALDALVEETYRDVDPADPEAEEYRLALRAVEAISNETSAKQWIDWRYDLPIQILRATCRTLLQAPTTAERAACHAAQQQAEADQALALAVATVRPAHPKTATVAEIRVVGKVVSVHFPEKREDFRAIVKGLGYIWENDCWQRTVGAFNGMPTDRAVELGHQLLTASFAICLLDDDLRQRAIAGEYAPECRRWVQAKIAGTYQGWFAIVWPRDEDFYAAARKLPASRYAAPQVVVPCEHFEQVLDFAQMHGFQLSKGAQELVANAQAARDQMLVAQPAPRKQPAEPVIVHAVPPVLAVPETVEIVEELKDD